LAKKADAVVEYYLKRLKMISRIIVHLNILTAVIEKSKLYGCNFESMVKYILLQLERGSQFKIEAIMYRVSRLNDYLLLSASKLQVAEQSVLDCKALVLEPPKNF
jgi:DNA polymerase zeta